MISSCSSDQDCTVDGCIDKRHHTLLHKFLLSSATGSDSEASEEVFAASVGQNGLFRRSRPHFMTIPVKVCHGN